MSEHVTGRAFSCVVAVKARLGELDALLNMSRNDAHSVQPVVEVLSGITGTGRVVSRLAEVVLALSVHGRRLMIDVSQLHPSSSLWRHPQGPFGYVLGALRDELGLHAPEAAAFVPVVRVDDTDHHRKQVALLLEDLRHGVAVRVPNVSVADPGLAARIDRALSSLGVAATDADLLLDVGFLARPLPAAVVADVVSNIARVPQPCRSVTLLAGSVPLLRWTTDRLRARPEHALWHQLLHRAPHLGYGDYGVIHPHAHDSPRSRGRTPRHPYLHYTSCQHSHFFTRRLPPTGLLAESDAELKRRYFGELAQRVTELYPDPPQSWGDRALDRYARHGGTADASRWIAIATSHHIAHLAAARDVVVEETPEGL